MSMVMLNITAWALKSNRPNCANFDSAKMNLVQVALSL